MARYKSEVLYRSYRGRRRPVSHYTLGRLPSWLAALGRTGRVGPAVVNRVLAVDVLAKPLLSAGGIDPRRAVPAWPRRPSAAAGGAERATAQPPSTGDPVVLWADTFTDALHPAAAERGGRGADAMPGTGWSSRTGRRAAG